MNMVVGNGTPQLTKINHYRKEFVLIYTLTSSLKIFKCPLDVFILKKFKIFERPERREEEPEGLRTPL